MLAILSRRSCLPSEKTRVGVAPAPCQSWRRSIRLDDVDLVAVAATGECDATALRPVKRDVAAVHPG